MNPSMQKKLDRIRKKYEEKALAICPITGITLTIGIPSCIATMEYRNPLADMKNILSLIESTTDLPSLPIEVLSGVFLAVLKRRGLFESHLSSIEQNILLQNVSPTILIKGIITLAKVTKEQSYLLQQFSPDSQLLVDESKKENSINLMVSNYITEVNSFIYPQQYLDSSRTIATTFTTSSTTKIIRAKTVLTTEIKGTIKKLLGILIEENVASPKLIDLLKISAQGENLLNLMAKDGLGNKVIAALERYATPTSLELAMSLKGIAKNLTTQDAAKQLFTKDLVSVSDSSLSKSHMSLKERLAMKLAGTTTPKATFSATSTTMETPVESILQDTVKVSDEEIDKLEAILNAPVYTSEEEKEQEEEKRLFTEVDEDENEGDEVAVAVAGEEDETI